jgi:hypothetical protein
VVSALVLGAAAVTFGVVYFAPQDLLINTSVHEPLPAARVGAASGPVPGSPAPTSPRPAILRRGAFSSGEHSTRGTALIVRVADGRTFVRLENLSTSNGPAVRVWLSSAAAPASDAAVERGRHLDLGGLKANHGDQNYAVPSRARLSRYRSVILWCARFKVVFGSAPLGG